MAYLSDDELLDTEGGFTVWGDKIGAGSAEETLEQALAEERLAELESEMEQDEHPIDYDAELETEEEEAAPVGEKRLKREIRAEAIRRLEEAARIEADFTVVVRGMEQAGPEPGRREQDHEISVGMCRWNIRRCRNRKLYSQLDEQPCIPAADGWELSGHSVLTAPMRCTT